MASRPVAHVRHGVMFFRDLGASDVPRTLAQFYTGRRAEGCFAPHYGEVKFHVPSDDQRPPRVSNGGRRGHGR